MARETNSPWNVLAVLGLTAAATFNWMACKIEETGTPKEAPKVEPEAAEPDDGSADTSGVEAGETEGTTEADGGDDDPGTTDEEGEQTITFSGVVSLGSTVQDADKGDLTVGAAVPGATVFVVGFPDLTATADTQGAFTISIPSPGAATLTDQTYQVVTWHKASNDVRFGKMTDVTPNDDLVDMGTIELTYTKRAGMKLVDDSANVITDSNCELVFSGFDDRIPVAYDSGPGRFFGDYLPAGTYPLQITCPNFAPKTIDVEVEATTSAGNWQQVPDIQLDPL